jgi:hypothetical protein
MPKLCTCYSHQFVKCRGQDKLGTGWKCADEFDRAHQAARDEEQRLFEERQKRPAYGREG